MIRKALYALLGTLLLCSAAFADNTRPITIGSSPAGELTLQQILNNIYGPGVISATADQLTTGVWQLPGTGTNTTTPILQFEQAGNAGSNVFGIWSILNPAVPTLTMIPIFNGPATPDDTAVLKWKAGAPNTVIITQVSGNPGAVNAGTFTGINRYGFGFYLAGPAGTFYTLDSLNGGNPQALAYNGAGNTWTLAFEDQPFASTDRDFNDLVVTAESITAAPDGGTTALLLGLAMAAGSFLPRRKK